MLRINIISQLLIFFTMAILINFLHLNVLIVSLVLLSAILFFSKNDGLLHAAKRFKWFFLVMLIIFSFNTPGEHFLAWPFTISPTHEGVLAGLTQILRILVILAALSLIMAVNTRQQLISGFYFIFSPLKYLGLKVERFAARLWLTLHYVELQAKESVRGDIFNRLKQIIDLKPNQVHEDTSDGFEANSQVSFQLPHFGMLDYAVLLLAILVIFKALA